MNTAVGIGYYYYILYDMFGMTNKNINNFDIILF